MKVRNIVASPQDVLLQTQPEGLCNISTGGKRPVSLSTFYSTFQIHSACKGVMSCSRWCNSSQPSAVETRVMICRFEMQGPISAYYRVKNDCFKH